MAVRIFLVAFLIAAALGSAPRAWAGYDRPTAGIPDKDGVLWDTPVYDPGSKRYFAYMWAHRLSDVYHGTNYANCDRQARAQYFKGVQGRLAIVDSMEVHEFLMRTFHPSELVLIGLRYWCTAHELQFSDGRYLKPGGFAPWDAHWNQDNAGCQGGPHDYMSIVYTAVAKGFRWAAKGSSKEFFGYFIEFPTGHP